MSRDWPVNPPDPGQSRAVPADAEEMAPRPASAARHPQRAAGPARRLHQHLQRQAPAPLPAAPGHPRHRLRRTAHGHSRRPHRRHPRPGPRRPRRRRRQAHPPRQRQAPHRHRPDPRPDPRPDAGPGPARPRQRRRHRRAAPRAHHRPRQKLPAHRQATRTPARNTTPAPPTQKPRTLIRVRGVLDVLRHHTCAPGRIRTRDPLLRRPVCAAGQPVCPQVNPCTGLSGSDREFPELTGRSGTQRARRPPSRTTVRTSTPWSSRCCLHLLPSDLGVLARMPVAQLDPVHETGARLFKRDRSCWKSGLRSARFTNSHCRRPSAPPRKMAADPMHCGGQTAPVRMSAFLRHISIMHLLSLGYEASGSGLRRLCRSLSGHLTSPSVWKVVVYGGPHLPRLSRFRRVSFTEWFTGVRGSPALVQGRSCRVRIGR